MTLLDIYTRFSPSPIRRKRRSLLLSWISVARERAALAGLTDDALRDVGLTRAEAAREAGRPFWDAPDHWH